MPVTATDRRAATRRYASSLPERFDVVHLGLGDDGHTASWPPAPHPDVDVVDSERTVELVADFRGRDRMTLTTLVVNEARTRVVLATGASKASIVERWLQHDAALPIDRVRRSGTTAFLDPAAAARLSM